MIMRRTTLGAFVALAMTAVMILLLGSPSQADPKKLLVSSSVSGPFRDNLATPLFTDDAKFVPLEEAHSTFYVKNNSRQAARTTVQVVNRGATNAFEAALTLDVDIDGTSSGGTLALPGTPGCPLVITGPSIKPGAVQAVDVSLAVADLAGQVGMSQAASLDFVVTLTQTGKNGQVEVCGAQAVAQPEVKGAQANSDGDGPDCERDVVVTASGGLTCVPTAVDAGAGYGNGEPRRPLAIAVLAALLVSVGVGTVVWTARRRRWPA